MPTLQVPAPLNTVGIAKLSETRGRFLETNSPLINIVKREEAQAQLGPRLVLHPLLSNLSWK